MKKVWITAALCIVLLCAGCGQAASDTAAQIETLNSLISEKESEISKQKEQLAEAEKKSLELQKQIDGLNQKLESAKPWFEMEESERQQQAEQLEAEKKAAEEAERLKKEAEAKVGYDTGITYNQLARTPDDYVDKKVKFSGKAIQVVEGDGEVNLRIAVNGNYNNVIFVYYEPSIVTSRVLENDYITIYGISDGLYSYESTMGGQITIPLIFVEKIDQ